MRLVARSVRLLWIVLLVASPALAEQGQGAPTSRSANRQQVQADQHGELVLADEHGKLVADQHGELVADQHGELVLTRQQVLADEHGTLVLDIAPTSSLTGPE